MTELSLAVLEEFRTKFPDRQIVPLYPNILIRVLPKPGTFGGIVLPEAYRNKKVYEGIVLKTFEPHTVHYKGKELIQRSQLLPGDHILFHYWAGVPVEGLPASDDPNSAHTEEYRMLQERTPFTDKTINELGDPIARLTYRQPSIEVRLREIVLDVYVKGYQDSCFGNNAQEKDVLALVPKILNEFELIPRNKVSKLEYVDTTRPE